MHHMRNCKSETVGKGMGILCILFIIVLGSPALSFLHSGSLVSAADYYVSSSGKDSNPGTESQPWLTIQTAADTMAAGDTVYIRAGTYQEQVVPKNSGSAGSYITYSAYSGEKPVIDGTSITLSTEQEGLFNIVNKSYIKVSGLTIKNSGPNEDTNGIFADNSSYITIEKNYTYNTVSSGIGVWDSSNITIDGNEVEFACNDGQQESITVAGTDTFEVKRSRNYRNKSNRRPQFN